MSTSDAPTPAESNAGAVPAPQAGKRVRTLWLAALGGVLVLGTLGYALTERAPPARCAEGMLPLEARCCPLGQTAAEGACVGRAERCPEGLSLDSEGQCVIEPARLEIPAGSAEIGPSDWEAQGVIEPKTLTTRTFWLDRSEVTYSRWKHCSKKGVCRNLRDAEPGLPVTMISVADAEAFCGFMGGRLPTEDEWIFAAISPEARRYPWGQTGLVCRRAVFGLDAGPCARGGTSPELAGSRPDGAGRAGHVDLAGNVAELAFRDKERVVALGGSFRSSVAAELKGWASVGYDAPRDDIGVRCAYDRPEPK